MNIMETKNDTEKKLCSREKTLVTHVVDLTIITLKERYHFKTSKTKIFVGHHERLVIYVKKKT